MKASMVLIIGWALLVLGCCALAFACLLAWVEWGVRAPGGWLSPDSDLHGLGREVEIAMAISALVGAGGIVFGWRMRRVKRGLIGVCEAAVPKNEKCQERGCRQSRD